MTYLIQKTSPVDRKTTAENVSYALPEIKIGLAVLRDCVPSQRTENRPE